MGHRDSVAVVGSAAGLLSLLFGWLTVRPSRVAAGTSLNLPDSFSWPGAALLLVLWLACLWLSLGRKDGRSGLALGITADLTLITAFALAGPAAGRLTGEAGPVARVSLGPGIWVTTAAAYMVLLAARQRLARSPAWRHLVSWVSLAGLAALLFAGALDNLSVVREFAANEPRFRQELLQHVFLFGGAVIAGAVIGIPLGVWTARSRRAERPVFFVANVTQTIPSLALFGLLIAPLSALSFTFPVLREIGIRGIGTAPAMIALVAYSLLPIVRNTHLGLRQVSPAVTDAGRGMGMGRAQLFRRVEVPLAAPMVLEGVRTAVVQGVGNATVAALIGAGGLGWFVFQGLGQAAYDLILVGALPIIALALAVDGLMRVAIRLAAPRGIGRGDR